jgi:phosphatidate cytidylyltransferase
VLIAALLATLFLLPIVAKVAVAAILALVAGYEWARLCRLGKAATALYAGAAAAAYVAMFSTPDKGPMVVMLFAVAFWLVVAPLWMWRGLQSAPAGVMAATGFVVIVPAAMALVLMDPWELLGVLVLVWIADIAAYFAGRAFGRHRLAPSISPGKTWEGAAAGVVGALAYAIICGTFFNGLPWMVYLAVATLLAVISVVGDLFESAVKRRAGVKDSGTLLPGHGGLLDRIDSALAVLPLAAVLSPVLKSL